MYIYTCIYIYISVLYNLVVLHEMLVSVWVIGENQRNFDFVGAWPNVVHFWKCMVMWYNFTTYISCRFTTDAYGLARFFRLWRNKIFEKWLITGLGIILLWRHLKKGIFLIIFVFWPVESKSDVHFRRPKLKNLVNPEKKLIFSGLSGVSGLGRHNLVWQCVL